MTPSAARPRRSLHRQILFWGSSGALLAVAGLIVLLSLNARLREQLSSATDAFVEEQLIADRISQAVMRQFLVVSSVHASGVQAPREFRASGDVVYEQLRLYLFRDLTPEERLQLETIREEHERLEVAEARAMELFARGDAEAGNEAFQLMSTHGFALLDALGEFLRMREGAVRDLRSAQQRTFRSMYVAGGAFGLVLLVGSVALLHFLLRRVEAPLTALSTAARRIEQGQLDARVPETGHEEFATVAASFNRMAVALREALDEARRSEEEVRSLNVELEQRVADRTAALRESEERFRTLASTAHDAIVTADARGCITYFNPGAERTFGYASDEVLGRPLTVLMPERFHEPHQKGLARFLATGEAHVVGRTVELEGRRKDGTEFPLDLSLASRKEDGTPTFIGIIRDITSRKETEQALRHYAANLEAANQELEAFSYSASHDLRAPLRSIQGFSQVLLEDYRERLDPEGIEHLRRVGAAAERMAVLIDDLLALSRASRIEMRHDRVDLSGMAERIVGELTAGEPERRAQFRIASGLTCKGDQRLLEVVLQNLMGNAWKFTGKRDGAVIEVGTTDGAERTYFVRDNGAGFDMTYADKLFDPFQRLHQSREFAGSGIGLALVQRIIRRHGGRVWAEGEVDRGATFYFTMSEG